jgi:hypothetical protein
MSEATTTPATDTAPPLTDNEHVRALLAIMQANRANSDDILAVARHMGEMERQLNAALGEIAAMRREMNDVRHPVKTAAQKAVRSLEHKVGDAKEKLATLRERFVEGCKNAVAAFREKGVAALDGLASFFHIRQGLEAIDRDMEKGIRLDQQSIDKIAAVSAEYHEVGRHMKNLGRAIRGKNAVAEAKPMGRVAKAAQAPAKLDKAMSTGIQKAARSALASLGRLEEKAARQREAKAERGEKKPSVLAGLQTLKEQAAQAQAEAPAPDRSRKQEAAL